MRTIFILVILVLLATAVPAVPAHAGGVVTVCDEAHLLAALAGGGTVTFACSGTIILSAEIVIAADTTIDGSGREVTISGNNAVRVLTVSEGVTLDLNELTVANGSADYGGGIYNYWGSTLTVSNSTFAGNRANCQDCAGGGIYNLSTLIVSNSTFSGNSADGGYGGAINNAGTLTVSNSTFSANSARPGGGIFNGNYGTVSNSTFFGNDAGAGGGIFNYSGTLTVSNSTFSGNSADSYGGGIYNVGTLTMSNSTFTGNRANCQDCAGGGIFNNSGTLTVSNSTFSNNSAGEGGGIHNWYTNGTVTLKNTIVANSPIGGNCAGTITDGAGNLSYPDTTCPGINVDPVLGPLQNNGGLTETMELGPGSAAIDAANDATCAAAPVNNLDQRGVTRPQGAHCDIGAFEWVCPSFVPPAQVGVEDIVAMASRWGWTNATPGWDPLFDLNLDSKIDILDIMLVTAAWGYTCS